MEKASPTLGAGDDPKTATPKTSTAYWSRINVAAFVFNVGVVAAGRLSFMGKNNRAVSNAHLTLVTPSGWAMRIWIVIFITELVFTVWQARAAGGRSDAVTKGIGPWFALACFCQAVWNIAFAQEWITIAATVLPSIAACLTVAVVGLAAYRKRDGITILSPEYWLVHFPFGLHAGWTTVASVVVINMTLESQTLSTRVAALVVSVVVATVAACFVALMFNDQAYLCAIAWGLASIADKGELRRETLPEAVADGVDRALRVLWMALVALGGVLVVSSMLVKPTKKDPVSLGVMADAADTAAVTTAVETHTKAE